MPLPRALLLTTALLGVGAGPAMAAPALEPLAPCYVFAGYDRETDRVDAEPVEIVATGFSPGAATRVLVDGETIAAGVRADALGALRYVAAPPAQARGEREFEVAVVDETDPGQTAVTASRVTALAAGIRPRRGSPQRRVRFRGRGFTQAGRPVYAHYVRRDRARRTVQLADRPDGPCGRFAVKRRRFPFKRVRPGRWTIRVDQFPEYRPAPPGAHVDLTVRVRRAPLPGSRRG